MAVFWRTDEGVCPYRLATLLMGEAASPPSPLRMERGVDSIIYKQRGRFLDVRRASLRCDGTPSSNEEGRFFVFSSAIPANEG